MSISLILFFISNAVLTGDESYLALYLVATIVQAISIAFTMYNIPIMLSLFLIVKLGWIDFMLIFSYIYSVYNFIFFAGYMSDANFYGMICLSASTFIFLLIHKNKNNKPKESNFFVHCLQRIFMFFYFLTKESFVIIASTSIILMELKTPLFTILSETNLNIGVYMYVCFTMVIPTIILSRIINGILLDLFISGTPNLTFLFALIIKHVFNYDNYVLSNIRISNTLLILYICFPILAMCIDTVIDFFYRPESCTVPKPLIMDHYSAYSYEEISYPQNLFNNPVTLNNELGLDLNTISSDPSSFGVPKRTGSGSLLDYRISYKGNYWVRVNNSQFFQESYVKSRFTQSISNFYAPRVCVDFAFTISNDMNYLNNSGVHSKISDFMHNISVESRADALVTTMMPNFFSSSDGFGYNPQPLLYDDELFVKGKVDLMVDHLNIPVLLIEDKTRQDKTRQDKTRQDKTRQGSASSFLDCVEQARNYARSSTHTAAFVMALKGTKFAFFIYDEDWHSDHHFNLKCEAYEDMLGLELNSEGIKPITQCNTYHPQFMIYDTSTSTHSSHILAMCSFLTYISKFHQGVGLDDNFTLPSHTGGNIILGSSTQIHRPGIALRLESDPFGKFRHIG